MENHTLLDLDMSESSCVRRMFHKWNESDEAAIKPLVLAILQKHGMSNLHVTKPRCETNVYPLYYWAYDKVGQNSRQVYKHILNEVLRLPSMPSVSLPREVLDPQLRHIANSEIDILVEDSGYFLFVEAKKAAVGQQSRFHRQMIRQYIQGRILEKLLRKPFALATIGANNAEPIRISLNTDERALLRLVNEERQSLEILDLPWSLLGATG